MTRVFRLLALALAVGSLFGASAARADSPMTLTLEGPETYMPGQPPAPFGGTFTLGPVGLPAMSIEVLVDGVVESTAITNEAGAYVAELPVFDSDVNHIVQARAFGGLPIETLSPAIIVKPLFAVTVTRAGAGGGVVVSTPGGIDCGPTCSMYVPNETEVTLAATPDEVSTFGGWSGPCGGTGDCTVLVTNDMSINATFDPLPPAQLVINPTSHHFGNVVVGSVSSPMGFTVTNIGGLPSGTVAISLTGSGASQFQILSTNCTTTLGPSQSCGVTARFAPTGAGSKVATLNAAASPGGVASATLAGNGLLPAQLVISPSSYDYGGVSIFSSESATFTVYNVGQATSGSVSLSMSGPNAAEFLIVGSSCGGPIPSGGTCFITVRFDPSSFGTKTATLSASANPGGLVLSHLNGTGTF